MQTDQLTLSQLHQQIAMTLTFQYNELMTETFFTLYPHFRVQFSHKTGKIKFLLSEDQILASFKAQTGTFTFHPRIISQLLKSIPYPRFRVKVLSEIASFIEEGKSVFAKHVLEVDLNLRPGDDVFVVDENDRFLAVGKLILPAKDVNQFKNGTAVKVRHGLRSKIIDENI